MAVKTIKKSSKTKSFKSEQDTVYVDSTKTEFGPVTVGCTDHGLFVANFGNWRVKDSSKTMDGYDLSKQQTLDSQNVHYVRRGNAQTKQALKQIREYVHGERKNFDLPIDWRGRGTAFQRKVWNQLTKIPYGKTQSYGEVAKKVGSPAGARAVGMACNRNPIGIVVPCHRVVGSNGDLTGYASGIPKKKKLLALEGA